jgi:hypothetical protein
LLDPAALVSPSCQAAASGTRPRRLSIMVCLLRRLLQLVRSGHLPNDLAASRRGTQSIRDCTTRQDPSPCQECNGYDPAASSWRTFPQQGLTCSNPRNFSRCILRRYGKCSNLDRPCGLRKRCLRATDVTSATRIVAARAGSTNRSIHEGASATTRPDLVQPGPGTWLKRIVTEGLKMARLAEAFPLKIAQLW